MPSTTLHAESAHPLKDIVPPTVLSQATIHPNAEEIDREVVTYLVDTWEWPSEKHKQGFISWKLSEVVLFMFPTGETNRVKLATELLLLGFLMDDWFDHHPLAENSLVVSRLQSLLSSSSSSSPPSPLSNSISPLTLTTTIDRMHASLFARILAVPTPRDSSSRRVLEAYMAMLACHCEASRGTGAASAALGDYLAFRETDVGMPICAELLYWTEPDLDAALGGAAERAMLRPLDRVANYHVSILNDVFSFEREWKAAQALEDGAVLVNGVAVLAKEANLSVHAARQLCLGLVRAWEVEFLSMAEGLLGSYGLGGQQGEARSLMDRAIKGIERRMTGAEAFSWRTSRYL
ncbi:isoprenoid synthase domain-containing protein [Chaetomium strumarium]|uniref:Terpene synthase n=1 Tax=Chaetomium strumarium TaxID=1170767 RepID=A0AAJ0M099_9PEZI|nr:isoprenoid synthase domain-containing protein [Chaetomium strumarium]